MFFRLFLIRMEVIMNYVRRSFGAMALTFCGMLSLHADLDQIVSPVLNNNVTDAADLNNALKQVAAYVLDEVARDYNFSFDEVKSHNGIKDKVNALIKASTEAQDPEVQNAGFTTPEIIKIESAVATFNAQIDALQVFNNSLPPQQVFNSVEECIEAAKKVKPATMITVLKIAKYGTNDADQKKAFLKLRDELKVNKSVDDILDWNPMSMSVKACPQDFVNYIAGFKKNVVAKISTMTPKQAADAHKFALAQARIVAREARARAIPGIDCDDFDDQILQAKSDIKARFHAANQELVDNFAEELTKKVLAKAAVKPGLMSRVWDKVPSIPKPSMPSFVSTGWNKLFSGSKNGGAAPVIDYGVFAGVLADLNGINTADQEEKIQQLRALRVQAEAINAAVQADDYNSEEQRAGLGAVVTAFIAKFHEVFADVQAVVNFMDTRAKAIGVRAAVGGMRTALTSGVNVRNALGDQADGLLNDFANALNEIYNAVDLRAQQN